MSTSKTVTVPLTTIFTAPVSCSSQWTYEAQFYNSIPGGLLLQNALQQDLDTACFPKGFLNAGRVPSAQVFSPGACPSGYTTPAVFQNGGTTTAICCPTEYSYFTTYTTINFYESSSLLFAGCVSTLGSNTATTVLARANNSDLNTTTVTGPITMWGQPVTVQFQPQDLLLYTTTASSLSTATSTSAVSSLTTAVPSATSATQLVATTSPEPTNSLSSGAIAGISIGAAAIVLVLVSIAALLIRQKRRTQTTPVTPLEKPNEMMIPYYNTQPALVEAPDGMAEARELEGDYIDRTGRRKTLAKCEVPG